MKSRLAMLLTLVAVVLFGAVFVPVNAQEPPVTTTLEEITADSESFYGSEVTLEGVVETFLNVNMFVLAEGATLDDDRVLVINNSGQSFSADVVVGDRVFVTGIVHPSRSQSEAEGMDMAATPDAAVAPTVDPNLTATPMAMEATPEGGTDMTTPDAAMEPTMDMAMATPVGEDMMPHIDALNFFYTYAEDLLDGYNDYTILEVTHVETVILQPDTE